MYEFISIDGKIEVYRNGVFEFSPDEKKTGFFRKKLRVFLKKFMGVE